jgi:CheY-like chemotaxis protein
MMTLNDLLNSMMLAELLFDRAVLSIRSPSSPFRQDNQRAAIRILHVDDEPDIREIVKLSLGLEPDLMTRSCGSGKEALAVAADWRPDLVLLDVMMPDMGGVATLARLRTDAKSRMPIVFMTGCSRNQEPEYFRSLGAAGVIFKPFEAATLADSVRTYLHH